jgi:hypothetical protein
MRATEGHHGPDPPLPFHANGLRVFPNKTRMVDRRAVGGVARTIRDHIGRSVDTGLCVSTDYYAITFVGRPFDTFGHHSLAVCLFCHLQIT